MVSCVAAGAGDKDVGERWLVHIVPDAREPRVEQRAMALAPPRAHIGAAEVGEDAGARPDIPGEERAIGSADEVVARHAIREGLVGRVGLHAGVNDRDDLEALRAQIGEQRLWLRETGGMPGEDAVAIHIVNIKPEVVAGDCAAAKALGDVAHPGVRIVAPARLAVAQRPAWRQWHAPGQLAVLPLHVGGRGTSEEVVGQLTLGHAEAQQRGVTRARVEVAPRGAVHEDAPGAAIRAQRRPEGQRRVHGAGIGSMRMRWVGTPEGETIAALIQWLGALARANDALARRQPLVAAQAPHGRQRIGQASDAQRVHATHAPRGIILGEGGVIGPAAGEAEWLRT